MGNTISLAAAVLTRLESLPNLTVFDNEEVDVAPAGQYVIFRDGFDRRFAEHLDGGNRRYEWSCEVVCAGKDQVQMRMAIVAVRNSLHGWRIEGALLNEVDNGASDIHDTTIPADVRFSRTLEFRLYTNWS